MYYLQTRYYDPEVGRFITIDDISYLAPDTINGLNLYAYCGNNPVMRVDGGGNKWWDWLISIGSIVCGIVLCATGIGVGIGAGLIVTGGLSLTTNILSAAGVNGKTVSIVSSVFSIAAGLIMLATPLAGLGASLIGSGIGGIGGGLLAEGLGFSYTTGAAIGSFIGGIIGGATYKALQNAGKISFKTSIKKLVENPLDPYSQEFIGPKQGEVVKK